MDLICMFFLRLPVYLFGPTAALSWNIRQAILDLVASWCCNTQQRWENPSHAFLHDICTINQLYSSWMLPKKLVHSGSGLVKKRPLLSDEEHTIIWNFWANFWQTKSRSRNQKTLPPETPREHSHDLNPKKFAPNWKGTSSIEPSISMTWPFGAFKIFIHKIFRV